MADRTVAAYRLFAQLGGEHGDDHVRRYRDAAGVCSGADRLAAGYQPDDRSAGDAQSVL
ncbi:hypothetical protein D3C79_699390 [compost metagenome]